MNDKKIRMVALDLDGTTLNDEKQISKRTLEAFEAAMEQNVHIVIATGRTFHSLPDQLFHIDGLEYVITSNGAQITELAGMKKVYEDFLPADGVAEVVSLMRGTGISVETFVEGRAYIDQREYDDIMENGSSYRDEEYIRQTRNPVPDILDFMMEHQDQIENINLSFEFLDEKERWRERLDTVSGTTLTSSFSHNFEIGGNGTSKAAALRYLMDRLHISKEELMAVGDSPNDEEMLKLAGLSAAVSNGAESTKAAADYITDTNDRDGVAKVIEKFVLQQQKH